MDTPRQLPPTLQGALEMAVRDMRHKAAEYRFQRIGNMHMHKNVRKAMAATYDECARLIEAHIGKMQDSSND